MNERIDTLLNASADNKKKIEELAKHSEFVYQQLEDTNKTVEKVNMKTTEFERKITVLEDHVNRLEGQQRRQNLRLYRLREEQGENLMKIVTDICGKVTQEVFQLQADICHRASQNHTGIT